MKAAGKICHQGLLLLDVVYTDGVVVVVNARCKNEVFVVNIAFVRVNAALLPVGIHHGGIQEGVIVVRRRIKETVGNERLIHQAGQPQVADRAGNENRVGLNEYDIQFGALQFQVLGHGEPTPAAADDDGSGPFRLPQFRLPVNDERSRAHGRSLLGTVIRRVLRRRAAVRFGTQAYLTRPPKHPGGGYARHCAFRPPQKITS